MQPEKIDNESQLIIGLSKDSHDSFQKLFNRYSRPLYQFSLNYLKSKEAAEDIVQQVFVQLWKNRKSLKTDTSFKSYLFTIALNEVRKQFNLLSRQNKLKHDLLFDFSNHQSNFDDNSDYQFLITKLEGFINCMPEKRRQVFIKKKIEDKSLKEISQELCITTKTVEYHITEAMKFLKKEFEKLHIKGLIFFHIFLMKEKS